MNRLSWAFSSLRSSRTHRTLRSSTGRAFSSRSNPSPSSASNPFFIPPPKPEDLPPISERLKPLIPFILYWTALTSLAYHLMQVRTVTKEDLARKDAQLSVLESLVGKYRMAHEQGTRMDETEVERELQMVGLRERTSLTEGEEEFMENRKITWKEIFFGGSSRAKLTEDEQEDVARKEWQQIINSASTQTPAPSTQTHPTLHPSLNQAVSEPERITGRRAPGAAVYM